MMTLAASRIQVGMRLQIGDAIGIVDAQRPSSKGSVRVIMSSGEVRRTYFLEPTEPVYVHEDEEEPDENKDAWEHIRRVRRSWKDR